MMSFKPPTSSLPLPNAIEYHLGRCLEAEAQIMFYANLQSRLAQIIGVCEGTSGTSGDVPIFGLKGHSISNVD